MNFRQILAAGVMCFGLLGISTEPANAVCVVNSASATPLTASTGTYTPPNPPSAQAIAITVTVNYLAVLGGTCSLSLSFNRTSLPAAMAITGGGGATLPYTLQTAAGGGNTLLYTGGGNPDASNTLAFSFTAPALSVPGDNDVNLTIYALAQPGNPQQAGSYQDNINLDIFTTTLGVITGRIARQGFTVTGQVAKACTIGGVYHPSADTATIPITGSGAVNTSPINKSYSNVVCNTPSNLQLTSQNGAVKTAGSISGLQNLINYSASATFSGASASLNTATAPTATGPESGSASPTTGITPNGTLGVTITPQSNSQRLVAGSYSDTLSIVITPQ